MVRTKYIELATIQANKSSLQRKHGAVVVKGNNVIATGYNRYIEPCGKYSNLRKLSIHAEKDALSKCSEEQLVGATLIVIRISPIGELIMSKPCKDCSRYIKRKRISVVYYSYSILPKKN